MIVSNLRVYIRERVAEIDNTLIEKNSAFYDDDIGETIIERSYQVQINNIIGGERTDYRQDSIDITLSIFGFGYREETKNYDELMDKALCIRDNIIELKNVFGAFQIVNASPGSITAGQLNGNENGFKIDINVTLDVAYIREE